MRKSLEKSIEKVIRRRIIKRRMTAILMVCALIITATVSYKMIRPGIAANDGSVEVAEDGTSTYDANAVDEKTIDELAEQMVVVNNDEPAEETDTTEETAVNNESTQTDCENDPLEVNSELVDLNDTNSEIITGEGVTGSTDTNIEMSEPASKEVETESQEHTNSTDIDIASTNGVNGQANDFSQSNEQTIDTTDKTDYESAEVESESEELEAEELETEELETEELETEIPEEIQSVFSYSDSNVDITVTLPDGCTVPVGAELSVTPIEEGTREYNSIVSQTEELVEGDTYKHNVYDICFVLDGEKIEPEDGNVLVSCVFKNMDVMLDENGETAEFSIVHFQDDGETEVLDSDVTEQSSDIGFTFETESFSAFDFTQASKKSDAKVQYSAEDILTNFGVSRNFAVFAINFHNNNHMEGAIAVKYLNGNSSSLGNTDNVYNYTKTSLKINFTKKIVRKGNEAVANQKFKFGLFEKDKDTSTYKLASIQGVDQTFEVTTNAEGIATHSFTIENYVNGKQYYIFEVGANNQPILDQGICKVGNTEYQVSYNYNGVSGNIPIEKVGNTSYIEYFCKPGGTSCNLIQTNNTTVPTVVMGATNNTRFYNTNQGYIVGQDGSEYGITDTCPIIVKETGVFPIDFTAEMNNLCKLSAALAKAANSDSVKVVNINATSGTYDYKNIYCGDTKLFGSSEENNKWMNDGLQTDDKLLVVNVDCTGRDSINTGHSCKIDGKDGNNWNESASRVIWNFYEVVDGEYKPFHGKIEYVGGTGTVFAPDAEISCMTSTNGSVIGETVEHPNCEIHHISLAGANATIERNIECVNTTKSVEIPKTKLCVKKVWKTNKGDEITGTELNKCPSVHVTLYQNDTVYRDKDGNEVSVDLSKDNNWCYTFNDLPEQNESGLKYAYTVREDYVNGCETTYTGPEMVNGVATIVITNQYRQTEADAEFVKIQKCFKGVSIEDISAMADSFSISVKRGTDELYTLTLKDSNVNSICKENADKTYDYIYTWSIKGNMFGTYNIKENNAEQNGYDLVVKVNGQELENGETVNKDNVEYLPDDNSYNVVIQPAEINVKGIKSESVNKDIKIKISDTTVLVAKMTSGTQIGGGTGNVYFVMTQKILSSNERALFINAFNEKIYQNDMADASNVFFYSCENSNGDIDFFGQTIGYNSQKKEITMKAGSKFESVYKASYDTKDEQSAEIVCENTYEKIVYELPETGGAGIWMFTFIGSILLLIGMFIFGCESVLKRERRYR